MGKSRTAVLLALLLVLPPAAWLLAGPAEAATTAWAGPVQTTEPLSDDIGAAVASFGHGLVESYTSSAGLVFRREAGPASWSAPKLVATNQVTPTFDMPAVAASEDNGFVVSEAGVDPERLTLHVIPLDQSTDHTYALGEGAQPFVVALGGGGAVVVTSQHYSSGLPTGGSVWTLSAGGTLTGPTSLGLPATDRVSALVLDASGSPEVFSTHCTSNCDQSTAAPVLSSIRVSTLTAAGTWSAPVSVIDNVTPIYLTAATGSGLTLLTWQDGSTSAWTPKGLEQRSGAWGTVETTPTGGTPLIAPDGTEVISGGGAVATRPAAGGAWSSAPAGPRPGLYCEGDDYPALRDNVLYITASVPDPVDANKCVLIESRLTVASATWSAGYSPQDAVAPTVTITSGPAAATSSSSADLTFTVTDNTPSPAVYCRLDGAVLPSCASPLTLTGLSSGPHRLLVVGKDSDGNYGGALRTWSVDHTTPVPTVTGPSSAVTLSSTIPVAWRATDTGGSGVASYDVRYQHAAAASTFSSWSYPTAWQNTTRASTTLSGAVGGTTYCFSERARDRAGNTSAWSAARCTTVALDDRALTASAGWSRTTGTSYYRGTISNTTRTGATLKSPTVQVSHTYLVATRCPHCGTVGIYAGSTLIGRISLAATTTQVRVVLALPKITLRSTIIVVKSLGTAPVHIDGLATTRI